jgi:hypothetical protein
MTTFITTILLVFGNLFLEPVGEGNENIPKEDTENVSNNAQGNGIKIGQDDLVL